MQTSSTIHLHIDNPTLLRLITEQVSTLKNMTINSDALPDCVITQAGGKQSYPAGTAIVECPKGAVRLGEIIDRLVYSLSGRHDHIENENQAIDLGEFTLFPANNHLVHHASQKDIHLTDKERLLLRFLFEALPNGLHRKDILKAVWGYADDAETHTLETHIYRLRQKLELCDAPNFIQVQNGIYSLGIKKPA